MSNNDTSAVMAAAVRRKIAPKPRPRRPKAVRYNAPPTTDIVSDRNFWNFTAHVEFRIVEHSNSGIGLRGRYEIQVLEDYGKPHIYLGGVQVDTKANRARVLTTSTHHGITLVDPRTMATRTIEPPKGASISSQVWSPTGACVDSPPSSAIVPADWPISPNKSPQPVRVLKKWCTSARSPALMFQLSACSARLKRGTTSISPNFAPT